MTGLAKLEDYKAPWEVDSNGADVAEDDQNIDPGKLKKYLHGLLSDKARLQATVTAVTGERDKLQTDLDAEIKKHEGDEERKERERQEALRAAEAKGDTKALALEVALDIEGISAKQAKTLAKSLRGETRDELAAHASELVEQFGLVKPANDAQETEGEPQAGAPAGRPRVARASGDPDRTAVKLPDPSDPVAVAAAFPRR